MLDPISDMLTRIRNAQKAGKKEVSFPASKLKLAIISVLKEHGFVSEWKEKEVKKGINYLRVFLKYNQISRKIKEPAIKGIDRVSKEGKRVYVRKNDIHKIKSGYGLALISTSRGVLSGEDARKKGLGGEYICKVW